ARVLAVRLAELSKCARRVLVNADDLFGENEVAEASGVPVARQRGSRHGLDRSWLDLPVRPVGSADQLGSQGHEAILVYDLGKGEPYIPTLIMVIQASA